MTSSLLQPALLEKVRGLTLVARRVVEGALHGLHRSPHQGLSIEFVQHRAYTPGDEPRRLDWRVLARSDRYVVKQFEQETNLRAFLVVDSSGSMAYAGPAHARPPESSETREKLDPSQPQTPPTHPDPAAAQSKHHYASVVAAALAHVLLHQGDSVGLMLSADRLVHQLPPRAAPSQILSICHALAQTPPDGSTDLPAVLHQLARGIKRKSLVILLSDLLDDPDRTLAGLSQLVHAGHEVMVIQVLDRREMQFDLGLAAAGVTILRDMETGRDFEAEPALVADLVRQEIRRFLRTLDQGCRRLNIHLIRTTTDVPPERVLSRYLTWRDRVRT